MGRFLQNAKLLSHNNYNSFLLLSKCNQNEWSAIRGYLLEKLSILIFSDRPLKIIYVAKEIELRNLFLITRKSISHNECPHLSIFLKIQDVFALFAYWQDANFRKLVFN